MYKFDAAPGDEEMRFKLHVTFKSKPAGPTNPESEVEIYAVNSNVFVQLPEDFEGNIEIHDLMGRMILSGKGVANSLNEFPINNGNGIFIVKAIDKDEVYSEKVYIK
ncbi:MAG: T9SS type A sorting domain-containing protein [Chlorobi bacterium]|nr:T9SS type A sorting domain-containing protein [Chlorobiota bacterium]